jgi:YggT family protein
MDVILGPLLMVVNMILNLYIWMLIIQAVMSWLIAFNVINTHNRFVYMLGDFLYRLTEPLLRPIRRILPDLGGIDLSPMVLIFAIIFMQNVLARVAFRFFGGYL